MMGVGRLLSSEGRGSSAGCLPHHGGTHGFSCRPPLPQTQAATRLGMEQVSTQKMTEHLEFQKKVIPLYP